MDRRNVPSSKKDTGVIQRTKIHQDWQVDVSHINTFRTFYFLISVLDGLSRYIVHWELRETMKELDIEMVITNDFKAFVREYGLTHVRTSPYYPQSNGKLERWYGLFKSECIRPGSPATKEEAEKRIAKYVNCYNTVRLHSTNGYITPTDCLSGFCRVAT